MNKQDSLMYINECIKNRKMILGIERFVWEGEGYIPDMDHIADFSGSNFADSIDASRKFIEAAPDGFFEFTVNDSNRSE